MERALRTATFAVVAMVVAACGQLAPVAPTPAIDAAIDVDNDTDIPVTIAINDLVLGSVSAHSKASVPTDGASPKPWDIGARMPSGRAIAYLSIMNDGQVAGSGTFILMTCSELALGSASTRGCRFRAIRRFRANRRPRFTMRP